MILSPAPPADDMVYDAAGNDVIDGGDGRDNLYAQAGDDGINGGSGNDVIFGGLGNDHATGGDGDDICMAVRAAIGCMVMLAMTFAGNSGNDFCLEVLVSIISPGRRDGMRCLSNVAAG
nr:hypothetical protein [[Phormidium] sp. ETS-05]